MTHTTTTKPNKRNSFCLNKSKRHQQDWGIIEDLALEWNTTPTETIFRSVREFDKIRQGLTIR